MTSYFEVVDKRGIVRFQASKQIDAEFYARSLIVDKGEEKPDIFEVQRDGAKPDE
jgi:hypothetical protein